MTPAIPCYNLISFHIIEKFSSSKLITWTFPTITATVKETLVSKTFSERNPAKFLFFRTSTNEWVYVFESYNELKTYALALVAKDFKPEVYQQFGHDMCVMYERNYQAVQLVRIYLGVFNTGAYTIQENGTSVKKNFSNFEAYCDIKDFINKFGIEFILIFNAILLKKRVLVYHSNALMLQRSLIQITHLISRSHRDPTEYLCPSIKNANVNLKGKSFIVAAIREKPNNLKPEYYDIFVNLETETINISASSKETFIMTKIHKELAKTVVQMTEEDCSDAKLYEVLYTKTDDILVNLRSLATTTTSENRPVITLEVLRARKMTAAMENFLFNLAIAENIMML